MKITARVLGAQSALQLELACALAHDGIGRMHLLVEPERVALRAPRIGAEAQ